MSSYLNISVFELPSLLQVPTKNQSNRTKAFEGSELNNIALNFKTQPLQTGILTIVETILKNFSDRSLHLFRHSTICLRRTRTERMNIRGEKEKGEGRRKGCKVLRIAYILTP